MKKNSFVGRSICTIYPDVKNQILNQTYCQPLSTRTEREEHISAQLAPYQECSAIAVRPRFPTASQQDDVEQGGWVAFRHEVDLRRLHQEVRG